MNAQNKLSTAELDDRTIQHIKNAIELLTKSKLELCSVGIEQYVAFLKVYQTIQPSDTYFLMSGTPVLLIEHIQKMLALLVGVSVETK